MWEWIVSIMSYRSRAVCPKGSMCFIARWISKARVNFKSYWDFSHAKVLCWTVTRWKEVKVMSSLRVYICFSQRSFIIDFNGARPVYPKLKWVGICIHYGLINQFPSVTVYKKHLQYHSTTRLIATSLADYDGVFIILNVSAPAEICMPYISLISLILGILFSAVTTAELTTSKLKAKVLFEFFSPLFSLLFHSFL